MSKPTANKPCPSCEVSVEPSSVVEGELVKGDASRKVTTVGYTCQECEHRWFVEEMGPWRARFSIEQEWFRKEPRYLCALCDNVPQSKEIPVCDECERKLASEGLSYGTTCVDCTDKYRCKLAFDPYNCDGDCLLSK